jgi:hypothetical protein
VRKYLTENAFCVFMAAVGSGVMAWLGLYEFSFNDYDAEASGSVHQLVTGHLLNFLLQAPPYGGSLLLRAPFALAPDLWGGGELADYRMLALPCMAATAALGLWLVNRMRQCERGALARGTLLAIFVANPVALYALEIGHAEEILAGVLCVAAVLAASSARVVWAGVLVGLAIATKSWSLVALAPVVLTLPHGRWRALLIAAVVASVFLAPFLIAQHLHGSVGAGVTINGTGIIFQPQQLWWFLGNRNVLVHGSQGLSMVAYRAAPAFVSLIAHPLIVLISFPLTLLWSRRRHGRASEPLALLVLVLLLRCMLDPWNNYYYAVPFLLALATWEVTQRRDPPLLALAAIALEWVCFRKLPFDRPLDQQAAFYLAWTVPAATMLALWLYAPEVLKRITSRLSRSSWVPRLSGDPSGVYSPPSR